MVKGRTRCTRGIQSAPTYEEFDPETADYYVLEAVYFEGRNARGITKRSCSLSVTEKEPGNFETPDIQSKERIESCARQWT